MAMVMVDYVGHAKKVLRDGSDIRTASDQVRTQAVSHR